jgi:Na+-driven multidrug efflux pump
MLAMVIWALSMSVAPFVGQNWGAGKRDRVRRSVFLGHGFALGWGIFAYLTLYALSPIAIGLATDDESVANAARTYLLIVPLGMGLMGVCANAWNSFNALGRPMPPLLMSAVQMLCLTIPLAILGNNLFGFAGIFIGGLVSQLAIALAAFVWLQRSIQGESKAPSYATSD